MTDTIGFKNGFSGSVERISWRTGRSGSAPPARRATRGDQAPAAQTIRPAVSAPAGVVSTKSSPFCSMAVTGKPVRIVTPSRSAARA